MEKDFEVLVLISDQHSGQITGFAGDPVIRTPNLDRIASEGTAFLNAYTPCPVCVPARACFLTGRYPLDIGMIDNGQSYASHEPTFAHCLGINGYQTSLCGRMHFLGMDQRHGFDKRLALDLTNTFWGGKCLDIGFRNRDIHELFALEESEPYFYDHYVAEEAVRYLEKNHEQKQMMVVGTYMPHCPLGAPQELVDYYREKMHLTPHDKNMPYRCDGVEKSRATFGYVSDEHTLDERAGYYAMIEVEDKLVGKVYDAFHAYCERKGSKGIFIYTSDHGDMMGDKGLFSKKVLFEYAARVPMIIRVDGMEHHEISTPVSLLDISATLSALTGSPELPYGEGRSLLPALKGEELEAIPIISNILGSAENITDLRLGTMVRLGKYKYITYEKQEEQDLLFDLEEDPYEHKNRITDLPEIAAKLKKIAAVHNYGSEIKLAKVKETSEFYINGKRVPNNLSLMTRWGKTHQELNETWHLI